MRRRRYERRSSRSTRFLPSISRSNPASFMRSNTPWPSRQVYYPNEIEEFAKVFFKPKQSQTPNDHAMMHKILNGPVERFEALEEDEQELYLKQLIAFRQLYSFMSQIIPFQDADLEKLYAFVRLLIARLPKGKIGPGVVLDDEVNLKYYRLQKTSDGSISLQAGDRGTVSAPTAVGTGVDRHEQVELSRLIDKINERFGTDFKPVDQLFFDQIKEEAVSDTAIQQAAMVNSLENFGFVFDKALEGKFIDRMDQNQEIFARYMNDKDFQKAVAEWMRREVYEQVRTENVQHSCCRHKVVTLYWTRRRRNFGTKIGRGINQAVATTSLRKATPPPNPQYNQNDNVRDTFTLAGSGAV